MKKNPGRRERRRLHFSNKRSYGKFRAKMNNYYMSHPWAVKNIRKRTLRITPVKAPAAKTKDAAGGSRA